MKSHLSATHIIDPDRYGVSFSLKQCHNFQIDQSKALDWLLKQGWRRFRLMSYWNEHEKSPGQYDFIALDKQIAQIRKAGGIVTLCLGSRQPRWPENHWPDWAWQLDKAQRSEALLGYLEAVINRYKSEKCIVSYQLENEALLKSFGTRPEVDRRRLRDEFTLIKLLDPHRPIIMSTSTSWGIPLRRPLPDIVGFSYYFTVWDGHKYKAAGHHAWLHRWRARLIRLLFGKPSFIHELQCEPWGAKDIWQMSPTEQDKSMSTEQIAHNLAQAHKTGLQPVDLWGAEWWYWRHLHGDDSIWSTVREQLT